MTFIDTNYFLRFLIMDQVKQFSQVRKLFDQGAKGEIDLFSSEVVFFELYWVLHSFYRYSKEQLVLSLTQILEMSFIKFDNSDRLIRTLELFKIHNLDLEDCYNLVFATENQAKNFASFDVKLQKIFLSE